MFVTAVILVLAIALAPQLRVSLAWVLAFFILLMAGDLLLAGLRKLRRRS